MVKVECTTLANGLNVRERQREEAKVPGCCPGLPGVFQSHLMRLERPEEKELEGEAGWGGNQQFFLRCKFEMPI